MHETDEKALLGKGIGSATASPHIMLTCFDTPSTHLTYSTLNSQSTYYSPHTHGKLLQLLAFTVMEVFK